MIRIRKWFWQWSPKTKSDLNPLHSAARMQVILERERQRSERGGSTFALLTMTLPGRTGQQHFDALTRAVCERIRLTDDAGLLGPNSVGVVLPETSAAGAHILADDICSRLPKGVTRPECEVFVHPLVPRPRISHPHLTSHPHNNSHPHSNGQNHNGHGNNGQGNNGHAELTPAGAGDDSGRISRRDHDEARSMQAFFVRPMPGWKRAIDIAGASLAIVLASPLMLLAALAVKCSSRGPVIFSQPRHTIGGRRFTMYKFRTMNTGAEQQKAALRQFSEQDGPAFKMVNDPRVTPLGRFLRATSIDELPQLFNVLLGDMSLVGPRPLPCDESDRCELWQQRRLDVTPGITCIWQVHGRSSVSFAEWIRMDIRYVRSRSLATDIQLMAQTVPAVVMRRGAH